MVNRQENKALESLFVFATNKSAVEKIIEEINITKKAKDFDKISLKKNPVVDNVELHVPVYREVSKDIKQEKPGLRFRISKANLELLKTYLNFMPVEKFLILHNVDMEIYERIKHVINNHEDFVVEDESKNYRSVGLLLRDLVSYVQAKFMELDRFMVELL